MRAIVALAAFFGGEYNRTFAQGLALRVLNGGLVAHLFDKENHN